MTEEQPGAAAIEQRRGRSQWWWAWMAGLTVLALVVAVSVAVAVRRAAPDVAVITPAVAEEGSAAGSGNADSPPLPRPCWDIPPLPVRDPTGRAVKPEPGTREQAAPEVSVSDGDLPVSSPIAPPLATSAPAPPPAISCPPPCAEAKARCTPPTGDAWCGEPGKSRRIPAQTLIYPGYCGLPHPCAEPSETTPGRVLGTYPLPPSADPSVGQGSTPAAPPRCGAVATASSAPDAGGQPGSSEPGASEPGASEPGTSEPGASGSASGGSVSSRHSPSR